jgi:predicted transcriptional regulator
VKYRSRTEIVRLILETASEDSDGVTRTKIMYKAFLSYAQLKEYISVLIEGGLIEHNVARNTYKTTVKGIQMLQACDRINQMMNKSVHK